MELSQVMQQGHVLDSSFSGSLLHCYYYHYPLRWFSWLRQGEIQLLNVGTVIYDVWTLAFWR